MAFTVDKPHAPPKKRARGRSVLQKWLRQPEPPLPGASTATSWRSGPCAPPSSPRPVSGLGSMTGLRLRRGREHTIWFLYGLCLAGDDLKARVLHPCPLCSREDRRLTIQVVMRRHIFFLLEMARERSDQDLKDQEISEGTWMPSPKRPVALLAACHRCSLVGLHYP